MTDNPLKDTMHMLEEMKKAKAAEQAAADEFTKKVETLIGKEMPKGRDLEMVRNNRWYLAIPGLDPYIIKRVELPRYSASGHSLMKVCFFQPLNFPVFEAARNLVTDGKMVPVVLRFLSPTGDVVEERTYEAVPVSLSESVLDYGDSAPLVGTMTFNVFGVKVANA